jgi:molybdopterin/thiamine biosynthesis adenylyltransferase
MVQRDNEIEGFLRGHCEGDLIPWRVQEEASRVFGLAIRAVEEAILRLNLLPARYERNRKAISMADQLRLFEATAIIVGCGGIGGYVIEELARIGVGTIKAIDPDIFEENNLNRQVLSTLSTLGRPKVEVARDRVAAINPAIAFIPIMASLDKGNARGLLAGASVVVDGLDSVSSRRTLSMACAELNLPLVHGAIGGWYGQVTTQYPGDTKVMEIYSRFKEEQGIEKVMGNLSFTPAVIASLQAAEACRLILGYDRAFDNRLLFINLLSMAIVRIECK